MRGLKVLGGPMLRGGIGRSQCESKSRRAKCRAGREGKWEDPENKPL